MITDKRIKWIERFKRKVGKGGNYKRKSNVKDRIDLSTISEVHELDEKIIRGLLKILSINPTYYYITEKEYEVLEKCIKYYKEC